MKEGQRTYSRQTQQLHLAQGDLRPMRFARACARAATVNRKTLITATCINSVQNRRPLLLPVMSSPQYFLSSVLIGSFPTIVEDIAALHTRPSVVSLQFAGLESFTCRHSFL